MSQALEKLLRGEHPLLTGLVGVVGGGVGGAWYISISGFVLGVLYALGALAIASMIVVLTGIVKYDLNGTAPAPASGPFSIPAGNLVGAGGVMHVAHAGANAGVRAEATMADVQQTQKEDASAKMDILKGEAELLGSGKFAEYHLAKAKRLLAAGQAKEAAYQAGASLSHGDLAEARAVLQAAKSAI